MARVSKVAATDVPLTLKEKLDAEWDRNKGVRCALSLTRWREVGGELIPTEGTRIPFDDTHQRRER